MINDRLIEQTIRGRFPHPISAAWHRVALTTTNADRIRQLIHCQEVTLRILTCLLMPDYLRGEPAPAVENLIQQLDRPSQGHWAGLVREMLRSLSHRDSSEVFFHEAINWYFDSRRRPSVNARRIELLVQLRNQDQHGAHPSSHVVRERSEKLHSEQLKLFQSLNWLVGYRLFRVLTVDPSRTGGFRGHLQFFTGIHPQTEPIRGKWTAPLIRGSLYLTNPEGNQILEASPLLQILDDPGSRSDGMFFLKGTKKKTRLILVNDYTGAQREEEVDLDGQSVSFQTWLSDRAHHPFSLLNVDIGKCLQIAEKRKSETNIGFGSRFECREQLGEGATAEVFRVWDDWDEAEYALKVLRKEYLKDPIFVKRFKREARAMRRARHPNILQMDEMGHLDDGRFFLKLPIVTGGTLQTRIDQGPIPEDQVITWAKQMLSGLTHLHEKHILHRDVKPSNYLIDDENQLYLTDFGITIQAGQRRLTQINERMGSIEYRAPEQNSGAEIDYRSDVYSLGVVLHVLLTGEQEAQVPGSGIGGSMGNLIRSMTARDPDDRPSAIEALAQLECPEDETTPMVRARMPQVEKETEEIPEVELLEEFSLSSPTVNEQLSSVHKVAPSKTLISEPEVLTELTVGRGQSCDIVLSSPMVSNEHLRIRLEKGQLFILDLQSSNGTRVNGRQTQDWTPMPPDARLQLGPTPIAKEEVDKWIVKLGGEPSLKRTRPKSLIIGRESPADIVIDLPMISQQHLVIKLEKGRLLIRDLSSTNGTWISKRRISGWQVLAPQRKLCLGSHEIPEKTILTWRRMLME